MKFWLLYAAGVAAVTIVSGVLLSGWWQLGAIFVGVIGVGLAMSRGFR